MEESSSQNPKIDQPWGLFKKKIACPQTTLDAHVVPGNQLIDLTVDQQVGKKKVAFQSPPYYYWGALTLQC